MNITKFDSNSCILIIDVQKDYDDVVYFDNFKKNIIKLLNKARNENMPICYIFEVDNKYSYWIDFYEEMTNKKRIKDTGEPFAFSRPNIKNKNETVFIKNGYDSFFQTGLHDFLQKKKYKTLYVCGLLTGVCVLNSTFTAFNSGYRIKLIKNCCSDRKIKRHNSVFDNYSDYLFIEVNI